ncbi:tyrosine-type recombinase/integrase [Nanoarchaeota archaeon]
MKNQYIQHLLREEFNRLKYIIDCKRDQLILNILYETGCTVNELVNIKIKHINFRNRTIKFPPESTKTNKKRFSFISPALAKQIKKFSSEQKEFLFSSRQSPQLTTKRVRQIIQSYSEAAGLGKINPQIIRYTHIAHALERGIPLTAIKKQIGIGRLRIVQVESVKTESRESSDPEDKEKDYRRFLSDE